jgi:hypothetical protein
MKSKLIAAMILALSTTSLAKTYTHKHQIGFMSYETEEACVADNGHWEEDFCIMDTADAVTITKKGRHYSVVVETITTNAHTCTYEADNGKLVGKNKIVSSSPSEIYNPETKKFTPSKCIVTVLFNKNKSVTVKTNGYQECQEFCGANASLEIEKAIAE